MGEDRASRVRTVDVEVILLEGRMPAVEHFESPCLIRLERSDCGISIFLASSGPLPAAASDAIPANRASAANAEWNDVFTAVSSLAGRHSSTSAMNSRRLKTNPFV